MLRLLIRIHRAVVGSESWHAAWQAVKAVLREHWPDALPTLGAGALTVWTWLSGLVLPLAIIAGIVVFSAIYGLRVQYELRHRLVPGSFRGRSPLDASGQQEPEIPDAVRKQLLRIWDALDSTRAFIAAAGEKRCQIQDMKTDIALLRDVLPRIEALDHQLTGARSSLSDNKKDLDVLLYYCTQNLTYQMLNVVLREIPEGIEEMHELKDVTEDRITKQKELANEYVKYVSMELGSTQWAREFRLRMEQAEAHAGQYVTEIPQDKRPANVDPYKFREYVIAKAKYDFAIRFLHAQREDSEEWLVSVLVTLQEHLRERRSQSI